MGLYISGGIWRVELSRKTFIVEQLPSSFWRYEGGMIKEEGSEVDEITDM